MSDKVRPLFAVNNLAPDNKTLASNLHAFADEIERGEHGNVGNVIVLVSSEILDFVVMGKPINVTEVVGLLAIAQAKATNTCREES